MAGTLNRSGGANALGLEQHLAAGTYRPQRHGHLKLAPAPRPCAPADRKRVLAGLSGEGRRVVAHLLSELGDWDASALATLHFYGESIVRLEQFRTARDSDARTVHSELRLNLQLRKSLGLEHLR